MHELPPGAVPLKQTPDFDEAGIPAPLLKKHSSGPGVWGLIRVLSGRLKYELAEQGRTLHLDAGHPGIIEPEQEHRVIPDGPVRFHVQFYRLEETAPANSDEDQGAPAPAEPFAYIDAESIHVMVERFYARIRRDPVLGPVFNTIIKDQWPKHLTLLKNFWSAILLRTGDYKGNPVSVHKKLINVPPEFFERWLRLFGETTDELFVDEAAHRIQDMARRMSLSLRMGMFGNIKD